MLSSAWINLHILVLIRFDILWEKLFVIKFRNSVRSIVICGRYILLTVLFSDINLYISTVFNITSYWMFLFILNEYINSGLITQFIRWLSRVVRKINQRNRLTHIIVGPRKFSDVWQTEFVCLFVTRSLLNQNRFSYEPILMIYIEIDETLETVSFFFVKLVGTWIYEAAGKS